MVWEPLIPLSLRERSERQSPDLAPDLDWEPLIPLSWRERGERQSVCGVAPAARVATRITDHSRGGQFVRSFVGCDLGAVVGEAAESLVSACGRVNELLTGGDIAIK